MFVLVVASLWFCFKAKRMPCISHDWLQIQQKASSCNMQIRTFRKYFGGPSRPELWSCCVFFCVECFFAYVHLCWLFASCFLDVLFLLSWVLFNVCVGVSCVLNMFFLSWLCFRVFLLELHVLLMSCVFCAVCVACSSTSHCVYVQLFFAPSFENKANR